MAKKYLSNDGLRYLWAKLKEKLGNKSDVGHTHSATEVSGLADVAKTGQYNSLSGKPTILNRATNGFDGAICAGSDGVAEYGRYCDFHYTKESTSDYSTRLECTGEHRNNVCLPSSEGTLVIGDKAYKVVTASSAPTTNNTSVITLVL